MKCNTLLLITLPLLAPTSLYGQIIQESDLFYEPNFKVRREGATSGLLNLSVDDTLINDSGSSGNQSWAHSSGGYAQVRSQIVMDVPLANLGAQLAAYTATIGDSLVFGREITTDFVLLEGEANVGPALEELVNQVAGASVLYHWESTATRTGLAIVPDQLYQVNLTITSGAGLPVNLLDYATFGITTAGISGASDESSQLLDLLSVVTIGNSSSTGEFSFVFQSDQNLSALDFQFAASTGVEVSLLGGTANNQNVLTFSGLEVIAIPEPGTLTLVGVFVACSTLRRRRID